MMVRAPDPQRPTTHNARRPDDRQRPATPDALTPSCHRPTTPGDHMLLFTYARVPYITLRAGAKFADRRQKTHRAHPHAPTLLHHTETYNKMLTKANKPHQTTRKQLTEVKCYGKIPFFLAKYLYVSEKYRNFASEIKTKWFPPPTPGAVYKAYGKRANMGAQDMGDRHHTTRTESRVTKPKKMRADGCGG